MSSVKCPFTDSANHKAVLKSRLRIEENISELETIQSILLNVEDPPLENTDWLLYLKKRVVGQQSGLLGKGSCNQA